MFSSSIRPRLQLPPIISHRGASAHAPENTMAAFERAYEMGALCIEFDVMLSSDCQAFIIHDTTLQRTTNGFGKVGRVSSSYLDSLDAGSWFNAKYNEPIPRLKKVLQWLGCHEMQANIEIKPYPGTGKKTAEQVIAELLELWPANKAWPLLSSFDSKALDVIATYGELPLGILYARHKTVDLARAAFLKAYSINLHKGDCTARIVNQLKDLGYVVCAYTVNNSFEAKHLFKLGVDAVFSNYANLL